MPTSILAQLIEHSNWTNDLIIQACRALSDEQLDVPPKSATVGTIRETLFHLVKSQRGYYRLLTVPVEERRKEGPGPSFDELRQAAADSDRALLTLVQDEEALSAKGRLRTSDE